MNPITVDSLKAKRIAVDQEIAQSKSKLRKILADAHEKGKYAPIDIHESLQRKIKKLGKESQELCLKIGAANRDMKIAHQKLFDRCFVTAAKNNLPKEKFEYLLEIAKSMSDDAKDAP